MKQILLFLSFFQTFIAAADITGKVLINEVMADPVNVAGLPETEYIELWNNSGTPVSLEGWTLFYDKKAVGLSAFSLPEDGYIVLYRADRDIMVAESGHTMPLESFPAQLANTGKALRLVDNQGNEVDNIAYPKAKRGFSWERVNDGWMVCEDPLGGTPGAVNSISGDDYPEPEDPDNPDGDSSGEQPEHPEITDAVSPEAGDLVINEILPEPFPGGAEYIELYNRSDRELDLSEVSIAIRREDGSLRNRCLLASGELFLEKEGYLVLTKERYGVIDFYETRNDFAIREVSLPILNNVSADVVLLCGKEDLVIDEVSYSHQWHVAAIKEQKGVALERINPDSDSNDSRNWTSAAQTAGYGTPGLQNSQYALLSELEVLLVEKPLYRHETDDYLIRYVTDSPEYSCRIAIYDLSGRRVALLKDNDTLGSSGEFVWDGKGGDGSDLRPGLYIFYAQLYHPKGKTKKFKCAFLVY